MLLLKNAAINIAIVLICLPLISYGEDECEIGICVEANKCPSAIHSIYESRSHNLQRCGWNKLIEKVCCPDDEISLHLGDSSSTTSTISEETSGASSENTLDGNSTTIIPGSTTKSNEPRGSVRKSEDACQRYKTAVPFQVNYHILGGENAEVGEFPHMTVLGYPNTEGGTDLMWICGGSLISERYILTAAHCVKSRRLPVRVLLGILNITEQSTFRREYNIENITSHPEYRSNYNDIALIRTRQTIEFGLNLYPACLYQRSNDPVEVLLITGWGRTEIGQDALSDVLQKARVVSVPLTTCNETYVQRVNRPLTLNHICAGPMDPTKPTDSCPGDSGGPLQVLAKDNIMYEIVGVVSFGLTDCGGDTASVYTRVYQYLDWIEPIVWGL